MKVQLLVIDPQKDFCDPNGSLSVKGADADMDRLAVMLKDRGHKFDDIHVTVDSHHLFDVAHPSYWVDSNGKNPSPFTLISVDDVENGVWTPSVPSLYRRSLDYVKALATNNRYQLCVWPVHCQIGSEGHNVMPDLLDALSEWESKPRIVDFVTKGSNPFTEHYSGVKAEVEDPKDPSTQLNTRLIKSLQEADMIAVAGEALSHCLRCTVQDIADAFGDDSYVSKITLLTDASSSVGGFEQLGDDFVRDMTKRGMKLSTTKDFLA